MPRLRAIYAWHTRCLPASHAACRRGPPASHKAGLFQWLCQCAECKRVGVVQAWPTCGPPVAHPWPTHGPGVAQAWAGPLPG